MHTCRRIATQTECKTLDIHARPIYTHTETWWSQCIGWHALPLVHKSAARSDWRIIGGFLPEVFVSKEGPLPTSVSRTVGFRWAVRLLWICFASRAIYVQCHARFGRAKHIPVNHYTVPLCCCAIRRWQLQSARTPDDVFVGGCFHYSDCCITQQWVQNKRTWETGSLEWMTRSWHYRAVDLIERPVYLVAAHVGLNSLIKSSHVREILRATIAKLETQKK